MTDQTIQPDDKKQVPLWVRVLVGILASGFTSWSLNFSSLHGIDFKTLGVGSEVIKSTIEGTLTGIFVAPECIPIAFAGLIAGAVYTFRISARTVRSSFTKSLPPETEE